MYFFEIVDARQHDVSVMLANLIAVLHGNKALSNEDMETLAEHSGGHLVLHEMEEK